MKKPLLQIILSVCLFAILPSCTKSPDSNTTNTDTHTYMSANVKNSKAVPTFTPYTTWASDLTLGMQLDTVVEITGTKASNSHTGQAGQAIKLHFQHYYPNTGTFNIDGVNIRAYWQNSGSSAQIPAITGPVTLDTASYEGASGSFSFTTTDSTEVKNALFSVSW